MIAIPDGRILLHEQMFDETTGDRMNHFYSILSLVVLTAAGCSQQPVSSSSLLDDSFDAREDVFSSSFDLSDFRGQTYLQFMTKAVKPAMDHVATNGYEVGSADDVVAAYNAADKKIKGRVNGAWGGLSNVKSIADELSGTVVNLNNLPGKIRSVDSGVDAYGLSTFLGLASGGGVAIKYADNNFGLNVHYDTTDERSGRSFGVGPTRGANDASDKNYLEDLQDFVRHTPDNAPEFFETLFHALLDSDTSNYDAVEAEGQTVLTDFLAVFTAEQARNLMDGKVSPHWDAALLEVTLLSAFHAGQEEVALFYQNPKTKKTSFTSETLRQTPCKVPVSKQRAAMRDYWQFSRNITDPGNCNRSGINITKNEFRRLGERITRYMFAKHADVAGNVRDAMKTSYTKNLFYSLSYYLIDDDAPAQYSRAEVDAVANAWVEFLRIVTDEAEQITEFIVEAEDAE
jgi:hypothetical protein